MPTLEELAKQLQLDLTVGVTQHTNHHQNTIDARGNRVKFEAGAVLNLEEPPSVGDVKKTAERVAKVCELAKREKLTMRAVGSLWSFSDAPVPGTSFTSKNCILVKTDRFAQSFKHPTQRELLYLTSGTQLHRINATLESQRRNLMTSGSSDGQSIAGAIGTGVHGSAFRFGAVHDSVHAFHISTPKGHFLVAREQGRFPKDVLEYFATAVDAKFMQDTKLFRALQVSFGSFGVMIGVVVETDEQYALRVVRRDFPSARLDTLLDVMEQTPGDFSRLAAIDPLFGPALPGDVPHHAQILFNPYARDTYKLLVMYQRHKVTPPTPFVWPDGFSEVWINLLKVLMPIVGELDPFFEPLVTSQFNGLKEVEGLGLRSEIFGEPNQPVAVHSVGVGIPFRRTAEALGIAHDLVEHRSFKQPGAGELRFVKSSDAYLAINHFAPITAVVGFDGLDIKDSWEFSREYLRRLDAKNIPFRIHWGKMHDLADPGIDTAARMTKMYGADLTAWKEARSAFLGDASKVFDNTLVQRLKLNQ